MCSWRGRKKNYCPDLRCERWIQIRDEANFNHSSVTEEECWVHRPDNIRNLLLLGGHESRRPLQRDAFHLLPRSRFSHSSRAICRTRPARNLPFPRCWHPPPPSLPHHPRSSSSPATVAMYIHRAKLQWIVSSKRRWSTEVSPRGIPRTRHAIRGCGVQILLLDESPKWQVGAW